MEKPKKFKDEKFEPIPASQIISYKKDDSKIKEMRKKLENLRLDSASKSVENESQIGYQFRAPSSEQVAKIHKNNDHFWSGLGVGGKRAQFACFGQVEAIQVEYVYKNLAILSFDQKVENQKWTLCENVRVMIRDLGLPDPDGNAALYERYRKLLTHDPVNDDYNRSPLMKSIVGDQLYCIRSAERRDMVKLPYEIKNIKVEIIDIFNLKGKFLERTFTRPECVDYIVQNAVKKNYKGEETKLYDKLKVAINYHRKTKTGEDFDKPIPFPKKGMAEVLIRLFREGFIAQPLQPKDDAAADSKLPANDAATDLKLPANDAAADSKLPANDTAADSKLPANDTATDSKLPATDAAADSKFPANDAAADSKSPVAVLSCPVSMTSRPTEVIVLSSDSEDDGDTVENQEHSESNEEDDNENDRFFEGIQHSDDDIFVEEDEDEEDEFDEDMYCESSVSSEDDSDSDY